MSQNESRFQALEQHAFSTNKHLDSIDNKLNDLLRVFKSSRNRPSTPKSSEQPPEQAEKPVTISPHYSQLPAITPTPARQRPASEPDTKRPVFESEAKRFDGRNDGYNGYDTKGLDEQHIGDRKGKEHEYSYEQGLPSPPAIMSSSSATVSTAFRPEDIGYFNPHVDEAYGKGDIVQLGKDVYYCDVHLFLGQAKSAAMAKGFYPIRTSLHNCLQGSAQQWYAAELSDLQ